MDSPYSLCVILCFATTVAVALPESSDAKWRVHIEERMEEMLHMIKRLNEVNEIQSNTIKKQSKTIGKQEVEITNLRRMVVTLKRRYENHKSSNIRPADVFTPNGTILSTIEKEHLHNEGITCLTHV